MNDLGGSIALRSHCRYTSAAGRPLRGNSIGASFSFDRCIPFQGRWAWNQHSAREDDSWGSHEKGRAARGKTVADSSSNAFDRLFQQVCRRDWTAPSMERPTSGRTSPRTICRAVGGRIRISIYHVTMNAHVGNLLHNQLLVGSVNPRSNIATVSLTLHDTNNNIIQSHVGQPLQFQSHPQDTCHLIQPRRPNVPYSYAKFLITPVDRSNFDPTKIFFHFSLSSSNSDQPTTTMTTTASTSPQTTNGTTNMLGTTFTSGAASSTSTDSIRIK